MKDKNMYLRKKKAENLNNILICENCGKQQITVCDSRVFMGTRRRRRNCNFCNHKSTTYEISNEDFERLLDEKKAFNVENVIEQLKEEREVAYANFNKYARDYELDLEDLYDDFFHKGLNRAIEIIIKEVHK